MKTVIALTFLLAGCATTDLPLVKATAVGIDQQKHVPLWTCEYRGGYTVERQPGTACEPYL